MKNERLLLVVLIGAFLSLSSPAHAMGELRTRPPGQPNAESTLQPLDSVSVNVEILDQLAIVTLTETFAVPDTTQESLGAYTLELPPGAIITEFVLWVNGERQDQPILPRDQAETFHSGVIFGNPDPLFPRDYGEGIFRIGLYPVTDSTNNRVEVKYFLALPRIEDLVEFALPLSSASAGTELKLSLQTQTDLDTALTTNEIPIDCPSDTVCSIDYTTPGPLSDFTLSYVFAEQPLFTTLSYEDPIPQQDDYFMLWTTPPRSFYGSAPEVGDRRLLFCIDVSLAMGEELAIVRSTLENIVDSLRTSDQFSVIAYDNSISTLDDQNFLDANSSNKREAVTFLRNLQSSSAGSDLYSALDKGLMLFENASPTDGVTNQLILLGRAVPNAGVTNWEAIKQNVRFANQDSSVQIFSFRIKTSEAEGLFRDLSKENSGTLVKIEEGDNLEEKIKEIINEVLSPPPLRNVRIIDESDPPNTRLWFPERTADLSIGQHFMKVARYGSDQTATLTLSVNDGQDEVDISEDIDFSAVPHTEFVSRFWADQRIGDLPSSAKNEIVNLSQRFHVLSELTAFPFVGYLDRITSVDRIAEQVRVIRDFTLFQNYPNPFNPETTIAYRVSESNPVTLRIFNMLGQRVRVLVDERKQPGEYRVVWDSRNDQGRLMPTGLYIYQLTVGDLQTSKKMLMIK